MIKKKPGILRVGTSGIALPGAKGTFPKEFQSTSRLHYYGSLFNTLEVNSSFYKVPQATTFEKWALDVPDDFQFTVKLWREITHAKELNFKPDDIDYFMKALSLMSAKKGCLLIQFPASITHKYFDKVEQILKRVQKLDSTCRIALEFRHTSWYNDVTYSLLNKYKASIVLHDMPKSSTMTLNETAQFIYLRFHGPKGDYKGSYPTEFLQKHARQIKKWLHQSKDVYVYFNNTMGDAYENAHTLIRYTSAGE